MYALKKALTERHGIRDDLDDIEIAGMTDSGYRPQHFEKTQNSGDE